MPATMGMIIERIPTLIIKLIDKTHRQSTDNLYSQSRNKILPINLIRYPGPYHVRHKVDDDDDYRGDY